MLLSDLEFGSFLCYSPHGQDERAQESRAWVERIKGEHGCGQARLPASVFVARRLSERLAETELHTLLTPETVLVPAPRSTLQRPGSLWVPALLANALVLQGLGREVVPCLKRTRALRKSAAVPAAERPSAREHFDSLEVTDFGFSGRDIVIVDDVITRGAMLLGAASRLALILPGIRIRGFALVRTLSDPEQFRNMFAPCLGHVRLLEDGQTRRRP